MKDKKKFSVGKAILIAIPVFMMSAGIPKTSTPTQCMPSSAANVKRRPATKSAPSARIGKKPRTSLRKTRVRFAAKEKRIETIHGGWI